MKIAIMGATGHVGKAVLFSLSGAGNTFYLFSRNAINAEKHLRSFFGSEKMYFCEYCSFNQFEYDAVFNCVGITEADSPYSMYSVSEYCDNLAIKYISCNAGGTTYISISSGAAYGTCFDKCASDGTCSRININNMDKGEHYCAVKLYTETKHRAYERLNIADLRIFGFFTRFIDLNQRYLLSDIINCVKRDEIFITNSDDIVRDYIHIEDFRQVLVTVLSLDAINASIDIRSAKPVAKFEILDFFEKKYSLRYKLDNDFAPYSNTGLKRNYYSQRRGIPGIRPVYTALEAISAETEFLLRER